jgi:two-component system KDP operon response regulator KdpE
MRTLRILIADGDEETIRLVCSIFNAEGWKTLIARDGAEALQTIEQELPDLVILNVSLPRVDGYETCRRIRKWSQVPIIILGPRDKPAEMVKCLNLGADDYIAKPFLTEELLARVRAVIRRTEPTVITPPCFTTGDLNIDFTKRRVTLGSKEIRLTPTEYSILQELALNADKVITYNYLLSKIWGPEYTQDREYLHVFICHLRSKLEPDPKNPKYITSVPWIGYQLKVLEVYSLSRTGETGLGYYNKN